MRGERRQTFWIRLAVNGQTHRVLSFDTLPGGQQQSFVNGCPLLVGRREFAYVDIEACEAEVQIESSHPIFLRIDAVGLDLCRPRVNRMQGIAGNNTDYHWPSLWDSTSLVSDSELRLLHADARQIENCDEFWDPFLHQQRIQHLARDNRYSHGGLRAYMWLRSIAAACQGQADYPNEITVPELAQRVRERYTFFRDLLPADAERQIETREVVFAQRNIRHDTSEVVEVVVGHQHLSESIRGLPTTRLFRAATNSGGALEYHLPAGLGPSILRLVIDREQLGATTRLMLQCDGRAPIDLKIDKSSNLNGLLTMPGRFEGAMASLASVHAEYDSGMFGGPFASCRFPRPYIRAATAELPIAGEVRTIRIWVDSAHGEFVDLGVQYLAARQVRLTETSFRYLSNWVQNPSDPEMARFAERELANDRLPMKRLLHFHHLMMSESVHPSDQVATPQENLERETSPTKNPSSDGVGIEQALGFGHRTTYRVNRAYHR